MLVVTGMKAGATVTCECGNVVAVPKRSGVPWLLIILGLGGLAFMCTGILAAIAIPNFIRFQSRAKQSECKTNMRSWYVGQRAASAEAGYQREFSRIPFIPERSNRYAYFVGAGPMEDRSGPQVRGVEEAQAIGVDTFRFPEERPITFEQLPPDVAQQAGISGECPDCNITLVCAGNVDRDDTLDVWSISTGERTIGAQRVAPGDPFHHVNDVTD